GVAGVPSHGPGPQTFCLAGRQQGVADGQRPSQRVGERLASAGIRTGGGGLLRPARRRSGGRPQGSGGDPRTRFTPKFAHGVGLFQRLDGPGAINLLLQKGHRIPEEISVVAVDATRVCVEEHPEITGANADPEKMGAKAAELLLKNLGEEDESLTDIVMPAHLTIRETSDKAPA